MRLPRVLAFLTVVSALLALSGCSPSTCNADNCATGCCSNGECHAGTAPILCGSSGRACVSCAQLEVCSSEGTCVAESSGGGGGTGGGGGNNGGGNTASGGGSELDGGTGGGSAGGGGSMGGGGAATGGGAGTGGGAAFTSDQIAAVRAAINLADGGGLLPLPIENALVTYLKPLVPASALADGGGNDLPGFFVQAEKDGPAIFVRVDPAVFLGGVTPGDAISFQVTAVARVAGAKMVTGTSNETRSSRGNPVMPLVQGANGTDFGRVAFDPWESRVINIPNGAILTNFSASGLGYKSAPFANNATGLEADGGFSPLRLRLPATLVDSEDLGINCTVSLAANPLWRFNSSQIQPSAWDAAELAPITCPAPRVLSAVSLGPSLAVVNFDRHVGNAPGGAFSIASDAGGLTVLDAGISGSSVLLTTSPQSGRDYTLRVGATMTDTRSTSVSTAANTAVFTGAGVNVCTPQVTISGLYGGSGGVNSTLNRDFIELHNRGNTPVNLAGWSLQYTGSMATTPWQVAPLSGIIGAGQFYLVLIDGQGDGGVFPAADALANINVGQSAGRMALFATTVPNNTACAVGAVDFVGYSTSVACAEGNLGAPSPSGTRMILRADAGCLDTNVNGLDFYSAPGAAPRNSASPAAVCPCAGP